MTTKVQTAASAPADSEAPVREAVIGRKVTVLFLGGLVVATVIATTAVQGWIDGKVEARVKDVQEEVRALRTDLREGMRDLRDELRALRPVAVAAPTGGR